MRSSAYLCDWWPPKLAWNAILVASVFLLLPLAHLRPIASLPLYTLEWPLLLLFLGTFTFFCRPSVWLTPLYRPLFFGGMLFLVGAGLAFFFNDVTWGMLGEAKSFLILPFLFALILARLKLSLEEHRLILSAWSLGLATLATAGIIAFFFGWLTYDGRLALLYTSPNHLAMLLAPGMLISLSGLFSMRLAGLLTLLSLLGALFLTRSYNAIFSLGLSSFFLRPSLLMGARHWWLLIPLLFLLLWGTHEFSTEKFQSLVTFDERSSLASRLMIWEAAWEISREAFPLGIGIGRFQEVYLAYQPLFPPYLEWAVPEPHNLLLSIFLATGSLGLLGFLLVCVATFWRLRRLSLLSNSEGDRAIARLYGVLLGLVPIMGLLDTPYFTHAGGITFWGIIGLAWSLQVKALDGESDGSRTSSNK